MRRLFGIAVVFFSPCLAWSQTSNGMPDAVPPPPAATSPAAVSSPDTSQRPIGAQPEVPARPQMGTAIDDWVPLKSAPSTDAGPSAALQATPVPTPVNPPPPRPPLGAPERPMGADSSIPLGPRRPPFSVPAPPRPPLSTLK